MMPQLSPGSDRANITAAARARARARPPSKQAAANHAANGKFPPEFHTDKTDPVSH